jgi:hypothetical protein
LEEEEEEEEEEDSGLIEGTIATLGRNTDENKETLSG